MEEHIGRLSIGISGACFELQYAPTLAIMRHHAIELHYTPSCAAGNIVHIYNYVLTTDKVKFRVLFNCRRLEAARKSLLGGHSQRLGK
eukprot:scaffold334274_cov18-Prasinocladus_malaysianus.AAC.2